MKTIVKTRNIVEKIAWWSALLGLAFAMLVLPTRASAQDNNQQDQGQGQDQQSQQDDPPSRVARLGYMEGSVSFQPAGETDWVQAVPNRPMTTGDKLWADKDSRAELQLGSAVIRLNANTGFSFLNLDDNTIQIQLTSGSLNLRVRRLDDNDDIEVDTPNLAFSVSEPGSYRVEASEDGTYSVVSIREGGGQSTGNGQTYTLHAGQRGTFSGTDSLNADVIDIGGPDQFDNWAYNRDHRYDQSRSAQYLSHDVVGYEDLDDNGDWRDDSSYGHVWFPSHVDAEWAPYHEGHWDWIEPWGYTWVDDSSWGYAPFHYGRWVTVGGRWGWVAGPVAVRAVYAPALVVFVGGGVGAGFGGNVGWFPLGPREVFVPSYHVSREYVNRVNISNTTVTNVQVTNIYNTTIVNRSTTITNVTYANRNVRGAVTVVPQRAFAGAQPVARAAVSVNAQQIASASVSARVAVAPTRESVLGAKAATANHVSAPPAAVMNRQVIAKKTPPPAPVPFAKQQQALAAHPGQPLARSEVRNLRPTGAAAAQPMVKQAPPGKPATANVGRPGNQPGNQSGAARPGQPAANNPAPSRPGQPAPNNQPNTQPGNRPGNQPAQNERPGAANPAPANRPPATQPNNRPEANRPAPTQPNAAPPANRPEANPARPTTSPMNNRPNAPANQPETNRPEATRPEANRPAPPPARNDRPAVAEPANRPENNRPAPNRPDTTRPEPNRTEPGSRPEMPSAAKPAPAPQRQQAKPQTPAEKKQEEEQRKKEQKPPV
jgi:hypothetical protein